MEHGAVSVTFAFVLGPISWEIPALVSARKVPSMRVDGSGTNVFAASHVCRFRRRATICRLR